MKLKQFLENCGKFIGGIVTYATLDGYVRNLKDTTLRYKLLEEHKKVERLSSELNERYRNDSTLELANVKLNKYNTELNDLTNNVNNEVNKIKEINSKLKDHNLDNIGELNNDLIYHTENIKNELSNSNNILNEVKELIDKLSSNNSGSSSNYIGYNNFRLELDNIINSLSNEQLSAVGHISASIFILLCLLSIISVFYGDSLIKYFKLEEKYPKLARFIQLRRRLQQYYFTLNIFLIILTLFFIIYINISVLYYT